MEQGQNTEQPVEQEASVEQTQPETQAEAPQETVTDQTTEDTTQQESTDTEQSNESETTNEEPSTEEGESEQKASFEPTGNEVFDSLGKAVTEAGLDPNTYADEINIQIEKGYDNISLSEESFKELSDKFGETVAEIMERQYVNEVQSMQKAEQQKVEQIYEKFGGKEQLEQIHSTLMKEELLSPEEAKDLTQMLKAGGIQQDLAVKRIKEVYMDSTDFTQNPTLVNDGEDVQPTGIEPISRREYTKAKLEAASKGDHAMVEQLNKRAEFTMSKRSDLWR